MADEASEDQPVGGPVEPPRLVRMSLRMHLPIQDEWRPWAMADIERRYGPDPSTADRDIQLPAWDSPAMPAATGPGHIPRRSLASRKADEQAAVGFRPDGQPASRGRALVDMSTLLELLPERYWPLLPLAAIAGVVIVVVLVMILVLSLR